MNNPYFPTAMVLSKGQGYKPNADLGDELEGAAGELSWPCANLFLDHNS